MLSCDRRLLLVTWNVSGSQENVFANPRSTLESSQIPDRGIHQFPTSSAVSEVPVHISTRAPVAREEQRIGNTIPMPTFASRPSTMSSFMPVDFLQNPMVGQQRQQTSELQFDEFPTSSSFKSWKKRFRNQVTTCSDFPSETMVWIKEVEMVDSVDELKSSRSVAGKKFPNFGVIQNSHFKKKGSLEEQKAQKEDRFLEDAADEFGYGREGVTPSPAPKSSLPPPKKKKRTQERDG